MNNNNSITSYEHENILRVYCQKQQKQQSNFFDDPRKNERLQSPLESVCMARLIPAAYSDHESTGIQASQNNPSRNHQIESQNRSHISNCIIQNRMENLDSKQTNNISSKEDKIQKEFKATENQIVAFYLLKHFAGVQVSFKHKTIKGSPKQVEKSFDAIKQVQEKYKMSKIVGEFSHNQKLYLTKKFRPYMFNQKQILGAITHILTKYNSSIYQNLKKMIKAKECYVVVVEKYDANLFLSEAERLLNEKIEPDRQMIKKLLIPHSIRSIKQSYDNEEEIINDSSEEDEPESFYKKIYGKQNEQIPKKKEINPESKRNSRNRQTTKKIEFLEGERETREKKVLYYKSLPFTQFQRDIFKNWVNKSEYLKMIDFNIETDYTKKIFEIKLTNQLAGQNESKKMKEAENYLNYQSQFDLKSLKNCRYVQKVVKSYIYNDNIAYQCWIVNGLLKIRGYYPKVSKIIKSIEFLQQIQLFKPAKVVYKLQLGELAPYCKHKEVKNMIIEEILNKSKEKKFYYLRTIHKFKFQSDQVKVQITRSHQKMEEELDREFENLILKNSVIWDLDIETKKLPQSIKSNYNLLPSLQDQQKLVIVAMDKKKANRDLSTVIQFIQQTNFQKDQLFFDIRHKPFVIDMMRDVAANPDVSALIVDNKICISGVKRQLLQMKSIIQEKLKKLQELQGHGMSLKKEQWVFLRQNKDKYVDEFYQKYQVLIEVSQLEVTLIGKVWSELMKARTELQDSLQNSKIIKRLTWKKQNKPEIELEDVRVIYDECQKEIVLSGFNQKKIDAVKRIIQSLQVEEKQSLDYPKWWQPQNNHFQLFQVIPSSQQYKDIANNFNVGSIKSIKRIQNKIVYQLYQQQKRFLNQLNNKKVQTRLLYHGTSKTHPALIYQDKQQCFNINYTSDRNFLGKAIYFAVQPIYSNSYAYRSTESGTKLMLYCEVIVGESEAVKVSQQSRTKVDTTYKSVERRERYESATTVTNGSQIYAIYKSRRSYPHYLIEYKK